MQRMDSEKEQTILPTIHMKYTVKNVLGIIQNKKKQLQYQLEKNNEQCPPVHHIMFEDNSNALNESSQSRIHTNSQNSKQDYFSNENKDKIQEYRLKTQISYDEQCEAEKKLHQSNKKLRYNYSNNPLNRISVNKSGIVNEKHESQINNSISSFITYFNKIPQIRRRRNSSNLDKTISLLRQFNPFFGKTNRLLGTCLLKMHKLVYKQANKQLYKIGDELISFFIILKGRVKLYNYSNKLKKNCEMGQTILEQMLFSNDRTKCALQSAKTLTETYLVQIKIEDYHRMSEQLIKYGCKVPLRQMQAMIKRNYIVKNWIRIQKNKFSLLK